MNMAYHLKEGDYIRDLMCIAPDHVEHMLSQALDAAKVPRHKYTEKAIKAIAKDCGCVITDEGLESCLNIHREDLSPAMMVKTSDKFEAFLRAFDEEAKSWKELWAEQHSL
jgi:hypothetical protein